jgi:hypothetical protein
MTRQQTTKILSETLENYLNPNKDTRIYIAKEVTFNYDSSDTIRVDYMRFKPVNNTISGIEKGDFYCYEIKSCAEDFHSKNGHNFIGDYNYYVMTLETYEEIEKELKWSKVGVYILSGNTLYLKKKTTRMNRKYPVAEMLLMMFRSANRENIKLQRK